MFHVEHQDVLAADRTCPRSTWNIPQSDTAANTPLGSNAVTCTCPGYAASAASNDCW